MERAKILTKEMSVRVIVNARLGCIHVKLMILINLSVNLIYCTGPSSSVFCNQEANRATQFIVSYFVSQVVVLNPPPTRSRGVNSSGIMRSVLQHMHSSGLDGRTRGTTIIECIMGCMNYTIYNSG